MQRQAKSSREFTETYTHYYPLIYGSIYSELGKTQEAEDLTQDVFTRFLKKMDQVTYTGTWLFSTRKNVMHDHYKKKRRRPRELDISQFAYDVREPGMICRDDMRELKLIINQAIESIEDESNRQILDRVACQGFSYEQTAQELGFTRRQVKYRYGLAIRRLRGYFSDKGINAVEDLL